nr:multiple epidermal growth factor-like domains protein 10 isoform X2 [Crassostrea gigas]
MYPLICHDLGFLGLLPMLFNMLDVTEAYDNVALHMPSYQSYPYKDNVMYDAANAVDGLKSNLSIGGGQCVVSAAGPETATWRVDLLSVHYIDHITLYFMTDNQHWDELNVRLPSFLGFSLFVSNSTDRLNGILCFKDIEFNISTIPEVFNTTCRMFGQYIIYYNERLSGVSYPSDYNNYAENDLCEVEVYGCPTVNPDCDEWDPMMCACLVCKPSYMYIEPQHETTDWPIGSYGYYYDEMCGHCKDPTQCSPYTGICLTGCSAGYFGPSCKEECHIGNYGYNCNETCGHCKDLSQCSTTSGFCHTGCSYGYTGGLCKKKCDIGLYGDLCNDTCGHCIDPAECNHVSGTCRTGCAAGYRGRLCIEHCDIGQYGHNCNETCGHCNNATQCSTVTGTCRTGCEAGYIGRLCKDVDQEKVMAISSLYGLIGVICFLVIIIGAQVLYIVLTRISIARNNARQQQNKEMVPAVYNDTFDAFDNKGCNIEYMEIGEPSYINTNARGLV